jgi:hypothetical protein
MVSAPVVTFWKTDHQQWQFSINLWTGILNDYHIGPYILRARVSVRHHRNFLRTHLSTRLHMRFQHKGAQTHYRPEVHQWLSERALDWSRKRSSSFLVCTLTWLESSRLFSLWGCLKTKYSRYWRGTVGRIRQFAGEIKNTIGIFEHLRVSFSRKVKLFVREHGGHFEHFL